MMIIYGKMKYKKSIQEVQVHEPVRVWLGILANQATSVAVIIIVGPLAPCVALPAATLSLLALWMIANALPLIQECYPPPTLAITCNQL